MSPHCLISIPGHGICLVSWSSLISLGVRPIILGTKGEILNFLLELCTDDDGIDDEWDHQMQVSILFTNPCSC